MKEETDPIEEDEWLLRRVHFVHFSKSTPKEKSPSAFEPRVNGRDPDDDGISLFRLACLDDASGILNTVTVEKRPKQGIVKLVVSEIFNLGLSVAPKPISSIPGHVVIPELNAANYESSKYQVKLLAIRLADLVRDPARVVREPQWD